MSSFPQKICCATMTNSCVYVHPCRLVGDCDGENEIDERYSMTAHDMLSQHLLYEIVSAHYC